MFKKAFSIAFITASVLIIALGFPLFSGMIEQNALIGFNGNVPLEPEEWIQLNRAYGAGAFAYGGFLLSYHTMALRRLKESSTRTFVKQGLLASVLSLIPAFLIMLILQ
ncbi:MAG: hypothetical protein EP346_01400 [Bacteroidetes bacterium]|nr:MAG: hypothetical protein EP346_01400 [Bacteroidota bacterium]